MLDNILEGKYDVEKRCFLEVKKNRRDFLWALNELVIAKGGLKVETDKCRSLF
jgi:NAD kinase